MVGLFRAPFGRGVSHPSDDDDTGTLFCLLKLGGVSGPALVVVGSWSISMLSSRRPPLGTGPSSRQEEVYSGYQVLSWFL